MKVDRTNAKAKNLANFGSANAAKKVESKDTTSFTGFMEKNDDLLFNDRMKKLMQNIFEQGEKLTKTIDVKELRAYKMLLKEFLNQVVDNSNRYTKTTNLDKRGRHKVFITVKKINKEIDALTEDMLEKQKDELKILQRVQDIRGLVLDLEL